MSRFDNWPAVRGTFACFVLGLALAALRTYGVSPVVPRIHDEFSYLLGADTFRSGRLTNPPLPSPESFDTFHELQRPTYASKYPPGQALVLAAGWVVSDHPIVGVWLGFASMVAALYWMLFAWVSRRWAAGSTAAAACWLAATYWSSTFWGGAVAATGGALVYGALPRLQLRPKVSAATAFGVGLAILANTRPFEGLLVAIPPIISVGRLCLSRDYAPLSDRVRSLVIPLSIVGAVTISFMTLENHAVTGRWLTTPYMAYHSQRDVAPLFIWQKPTPHVFADIRDRDFETRGTQRFLDLRSNYFRSMGDRFTSALTFLIPAYLLFPFLWFRKVGRTSTAGIALAGLGLAMLGSLGSVYYAPHYLAPAAPPLIALLAVCMQRFAEDGGPLPTLRAGLAWTSIAAWAIPGLAAIVGSLPGGRFHVEASDWATARVRLADSLASTGGQHLLFVTYPQNHDVNQEWVFNGANLTAQRVIWALDQGVEKDKALLEAFPNTQPHVLAVLDDSPFYTLRPFP